MSDTPAGSADAPQPQRRGGWQLFRLGHIPVRADGSSLLLLAIGAYWYYGFMLDLQPLGNHVVVIATAAAALLLFGSILLHEMGHAIASLIAGVRVMSITLFALGGATYTEETRTPGKELLVVGGGPFVSFLLFFAFGFLASFTEQWVVVSLVCSVLAGTNLILGIFNVIPAYPLDGGRLLRAIVWTVTQRPHLSTRIAARVGQGFAGLLMLGGVVGALNLDLPPALTQGIPRYIFDGDLFRVLIGFFLFRGATDAYKRAQFSERIEQRSLREAMGTLPPLLSPHATLDQALALVQERPSLLWPVGDPLAGGLLLGAIDSVPSDRWPSVTVGQVMAPLEVASIDVGTPLRGAVARLGSSPGNMLIVTEGGHPVGLLTPSLVADLVG